MKADLIAFAEHYLECWNAAEAYQRTHPKAKRNTCWTNGSQLLRNTEVQAHISRRMKELAMSAEETIARLSDQARGNLLPFLKFNDGNIYIDLTNPEAQRFMHLVKTVRLSNRVLRSTTTVSGGKDQKGKSGKTKPTSIRTTDDLIQQWVQIELHDVQGALTLIGRHHKLFTDKFELGGELTINGYDEMMEKVFGGNQD